MPVILALDQGTTSTRAAVFDRDGNVCAFARKELLQYYPRPGWIEHDANEIWSAQLATAQKALRDAGVAGTGVAAIGITNQRETTILWDRRTSQPISRAIVWQDRRTSAICEDLKARGWRERIEQRTGLVIDPYFSATKIAWLLDNAEGLRERSERGEIAFGTVDSWLLWKLTGGKRHATDVTNASRTMLFDIHRLCWDEELCSALGIPAALLPEVLPSTADFGSAEPDLFGAPVLIGGVAGDQQASLVGQAGFAEGLAKNTYGTGSFVVLNTGDRVVRSRRGLLATIAFGFEPGKVAYALEGSVFITGAAIQWLRDGLRIIDDAARVDDLAGEVPDAGGVFFVPAFAGLGAPYWDPHARGTIAGITRGTTRAHIARAALEAMAYQSAEVVDAMEKDAGMTLRELRVDGGASKSAIAMQFQADLLGVPVVRARLSETTALGAAYLAGLQSGFWPDVQSLSDRWRPGARFEPRGDMERRAAQLAAWRRAVERSRGWVQEP